MDGGLLTLLCQEDCFLIPICAAVSRLRLQRATQISTPGLHLDRCSLWTTYMGSRTSVHQSGQRGNPEGNHARGLEFLCGSLRLAASLNEGLSSCQGWTFSHLPPTPFVPSDLCDISLPPLSFFHRDVSHSFPTFLWYLILSWADHAFSVVAYWYHVINKLKFQEDKRSKPILKSLGI